MQKLNVSSVLQEQLETSWNRLQQETTEEPILVIEYGVNDITNIGEDRKEADRLRRLEKTKEAGKSGAVAQNSLIR